VLVSATATVVLRSRVRCVLDNDADAVIDSFDLSDT
jgi:hypothetical protein